MQEALDQNLIELSLTANGNLFFRDPLDYTLENTSQETLDLCFPAGLIAASIDRQVQDLMLTETMVVRLGPGVVKDGRLSAACINEMKHAPEEGAEYELGSMAQGDLWKLAQVIDDRAAKNRLGAQMAIWAVTDQFTLDDLETPSDDEGAQLASAIRPLLCLTTGEVELAHQLLADAGTDIQLYAGENPLSAEYCSSQGIPTFDQLEQAGERALIAVGVGLAACVLVVGGTVYLVIRLIRRGK